MEFDILTYVKQSLGMEGTSHNDNLLKNLIDEVKLYLLDAGTNEIIVDSKLAAGCICRGVSDLWTYGAGEAKLSDYFYQRAAQLRSIKLEDLEG